MTKAQEKEDAKAPPPPDSTFQLPSGGGFRDMTKGEREAEQRGYDAATSAGSVMGNPEPTDGDDARAWQKGYQRGLTDLNAGTVSPPNASEGKEADDSKAKSRR